MDDHCHYSFYPCEVCPYLDCVHTYHRGILGLIAAERRRLVWELHKKRYSNAIIARMFGLTDRSVRAIIQKYYEGVYSE